MIKCNWMSAGILSIGFIFTFLIGGFIGSVREVESYRKDAIEKGVGKYDEKTGAFRLKNRIELRTYVWDEGLPCQNPQPLHIPDLIGNEIPSK